MMSTPHRLAPFALALTAGLAPPGPARAEADDSLRPLVAAVLEAYGGEEALRTVAGYRASGHQRATQRGVWIRAERWFARPDRLRLDLAYPDHRELRLTDGAQGWTGPDDAHLRPAQPAMLQSMRLQTARFDLPLRLLERIDELRRADSDAEGRVVLRLSLDEGLQFDWHVAPETHLVERMTMRMAGPPPMAFAADYTDFREVDGILVPFRETTTAGATVTSEFFLTGFEWNPDGLEERVRTMSTKEMSVDVAKLQEFGARYTAAWCSQNASSVAAFFAENGSLTINDGEPSVGRGAITEAAQGFMSAFPDMIVAMDEVGIEGERAIYRWTLTGTNTGPGGTGKAVRISGYEEWTIGPGGLIAESKGNFDAAEYERQLEVGFDGE